MPVRNYAQMYFIFVRNIHCLVAINWARVFCVITELHILRTVLSFQTKPRTTLHMFFCLKTCYGGNWAVSNHTSRVNLVLFVKIFTCKRGAKYERLFFSWSKPDLSYSVFTPQGRTSQLIPVTRKLQQPPLWQTAALDTSVTAAPWNYSEFIFFLWSSHEPAPKCEIKKLTWMQLIQSHKVSIMLRYLLQTDAAS